MMKKFRRFWKRGMALLLSVLMIASVPYVAQAATNTYLLSSYSKLNTNPAAPYSMEYFDTADYSFKKMPVYMETGNANQNYWSVKDASSTLIKGWTQQATSTEYSVVRFTAPDSGVATLLNAGAGTIASRYETNMFTTGEMMIVQKGPEGYTPIWPSSGSWEWNAIPQKTSATDTTTNMEWPSDLKTYLNSGDEILFIMRSTQPGKRVSISFATGVRLEEASEDTGSLRPDSWDTYYKGADDQLAAATVVRSSPYVKKETNLDTEPFTKELINSTAGYQKLDTYNYNEDNPNISYWSASGDASVRMGPYYMMATANNYCAAVYHASKNGYANLENMYELFSSLNAAYDEAEVMVVQSSGEGFAPVWPQKGVWAWQTVPKGDGSNNKTGMTMDLDAYLKAGDKLALVVRSSNTSKGVTWLGSDCQVSFTAVDTDYRGIYPSAWSDTFEGYEYRLPLNGWVTYRGSPYINKTENAGLFTSEYNAGDGFVLMENNVTTASPYYWQSASGQAIIKPYMQTATATTYSALVFHPPGSGYLNISNYVDIYTHYSSSGANEPAQVMLVQGSEEKGYAPIWPNKGVWEYQTLPMRTSAEDTAALDMGEINTYVQEGDEIYFVVRSGLTATGATAMQSDLIVKYLSAPDDGAGLYPTAWSDTFEGYEKIEVGMEDNLATLSVAQGDGEIRQLLPYHPVFLETDRANPTFKNIPTGLEGKSFICTYCWDSSQEVGWTREATAETDGWIYAIATNRNRSKMIADGFIAMPVEVTDLFYSANTGTSDHCALYKKYVNAGDKVTIYDRWTLLIFDTLENEKDYAISDSFLPPVLVMNGTQEADAYAKENRLWQGVPDVVRTSENVLYAAWGTGGPHEVAAGNYSVISRSDDGGETWTEFMYVAADPAAEKGRVLETTFFRAPDGSLWLFANSGIAGNSYNGFWVMHTENPNDPNPDWSEPQRIGHGMFNTSVTVLSDGTWLLAGMAVYDDVDYTDIWASDDQGATWYLKGQAYIPETYVDEGCIIELNDGRLWLTVRSNADYGIAESFSSDGGRTWTEGRDSGLGGPGSKFVIKRLKSGNLLMINHYEFIGRDHMTASLSTDDGKTWPYHLLLDERKTSYPHATTWDYDGTEVITAVYDHERYDAKQIYLAQFTEEDIINSSFSSAYAREKVLLDSLSGDALFDYNNSWFVQQDTNPYPWGYCTYGYFDGGEFKTMETYVPQNGEAPAFWQSESGRSNITSWRVLATQEETPLISFFVGKSGYLEISEDAVNPLQTNGGAGRFMIVQVNGDGEYCPLYPSKGRWEWQDISTAPTEIGTVRTYLESGDKVYTLWQTADGGDLLIETMAHFKFTYSSTDTESLRPALWTRWLGGGILETDQTAVDQITEKINALAGITLTDKQRIKDIRGEYENLTDVQKAMVGNLEVLTAAEQKIANLEKGTDIASYMGILSDALPDALNQESLAAYQETAAAYQMLTEEEKARVTGESSLAGIQEKVGQYLTVQARVGKVEKLIDAIPLPYDLTVRASLEKAYGEFKKLSEEEQALVENRALMEAIRRITSLKDSDQNLPNYLNNKIIESLPPLEEITLDDAYQIAYAAGFYEALTEAQQGSVTNVGKLKAAVEKIKSLETELAGTFYTVTAEGAENGTIVTSGINRYSQGRSPVYQMIPFVGCKLVDVMVDGESVGPVSTYTFSDLSKDHTISAAFERSKEIWNYDISWFVSQGIQPYEGSYYTFEYFDMAAKEFKQLETYVGDAVPPFWQDVTGTVQIKGWEMTASDKLYAAVAFNAPEDGRVALTNQTPVTGGNTKGQIMLLQKSGNVYHVLMDWLDVPEGQTVVLPDMDAYVRAGDTVYYLYRSANSEMSIGGMTPGVAYEIGAEDTENQYPTQWTDLSTALGLKEEEKQAFTITVVSGEGGTITPVTDRYEAGKDVAFQITAYHGYEISDVLVDGVSVGKTSRYTFTELRGNHTIEAKFTKTAAVNSENPASSEIAVSGGVSTGDLVKIPYLIGLFILCAGAFVGIGICLKRKKRSTK